MAESNGESIVLEHLRALRAGQDRLEGKLTELVTRVGSVESHVVQLHRNVALIHDDIAGLQVRMDRFDARLDRVERRLDIAYEP